MSTNEERLKILISKYRNGHKYVIWEVFQLIKGALHLYSYYDHSGVREAQDFEQVALIGIWKALESFDENRGATATSWILTIVNQKLSREVRHIVRDHGDRNIHFSRVADLSDNKEYDSIIYNLSSETWPFEGITHTDEEAYLDYILKVEDRLAKINLKLARAFMVKIIWPNLERDTLAIMLGVGRMSIAKYFRTMRKIMEDVYNETAN